MSNYEVKTQQFAGPLGKLLELIEEKKLEITQISLAEVTADFLGYVKGLGEKTESGVLADFLVVAAKLVLIKSKALLPMLELSNEEEAEIKDLEGRLKLYREFRLAGEHIQKLWNKNRIAYGRELLSSLGDQAIFYPPPELAVSDLTKAINHLVSALQALIPESQTIKKAVGTIEQKIEELLNRLKEAGPGRMGRHSFQNLAQEKSRSEVIVLFLAILHLLKDKIIQVQQSEKFSDITVEKLENRN